MFTLFASLALLAAPAQDEAFENACAAWARQVDAEFRIEDPLPTLDVLWDRKALFDRTFKGIPEPEKLFPGCREELAAGTALGPGLHQASRGGGSYRFLRLRRLGGGPSALFRLLPAKGGHNYQEYLLGPGEGGRIAILDFHSHLTGLFFSDTFRFEFLKRLAGKDDAVAALPPALQSEVRQVIAVADFVTAASATGDPREVLKRYDGLPEALRKDPRVLAARLGRATSLGVDVAFAAAEDLLRHTDSSPMACLQTLSVFGRSGKRARALEVLALMERGLGTDGNLEYNRAELLAAERPAEAEASFRKAVALEPELPAPNWALLTLLNARKEHAATAVQLKVIETRLGIRVKDLSKVEAFADFAASKPGADWARDRQPDPERTYDLKSLGSISPLGQKTDFRNHMWSDMKFSMRSGDRVINENEVLEASSFAGEVEVLALAGVQASRQRVTFSKAVRRVEGQARPYGFQGKAVIVQRLPQNEFTFSYEDGKALEGEDLKGVRKALHKREENDEDDGDDWAPPKPLRVGESWSPDSAKLVKSFGMEDGGADPAQTRAQFTLARVEARDGADYATVDAAIRVPLTQLGPMKLSSPCVFSLAMEIRARVEGLEDVAVKITGSMRGDSPVQVPNVKDARIRLDGTMGGRTLLIPRD